MKGTYSTKNPCPHAPTAQVAITSLAHAQEIIEFLKHDTREYIYTLSEKGYEISCLTLRHLANIGKTT